MMVFDLHLRIAGLLLLGLAVLNLFVPLRFNWRAELSRVSLLNRQIFQVHSAFIILILVLFALLTLTCADELLVPTTLARAVLVGLTAFWLARLYAQWFVYDRSLWRGHRFNTVVHYAFTALWAYFVFTFGGALWVNVASVTAG